MMESNSEMTNGNSACAEEVPQIDHEEVVVSQTSHVKVKRITISRLHTYDFTDPQRTIVYTMVQKNVACTCFYPSFLLIILDICKVYM